MSTNSKIIVQANREGDFRKLLHALSAFKTGFYIKNGYFITTKELKYPYNQKNIYLSETIYKYLKANTSEMEKVEDIKYLNPSVINLEELVAIFPEIYSLVKEPKVNKDAKISEIETILKYMEEFSGKEIEKLIINYTTFGTGSSYTYEELNGKIYIYLYPRYDCYDYSLKASLIRAFITVMYKTKTHYEYNSLVDFFINTLKLENVELINSKKEHTHKASTEVLGNLEKESNELLATLGIINISNIQIIEDKVIIEGFGELKFLSKNETNLVKLLAKHRPNIVTYDQIASLLWEKDEKYSLSAMSKIVERIRGKLNKNRIFNEVIITHRSKGYSLV